ncbi:hypothetical protein LINPERHAP2_LOCUS29161 [Linum perenne]
MKKIERKETDEHESSDQADDMRVPMKQIDDVRLQGVYIYCYDTRGCTEQLSEDTLLHSLEQITGRRLILAFKTCTL